jgi:hypothetical protein
MIIDNAGGVQKGATQNKLATIKETSWPASYFRPEQFGRAAAF